MGRFDSKQSCPKSVKTGSQKMELNNYKVCRFADTFGAFDLLAPL